MSAEPSRPRGEPSTAGWQPPEPNNLQRLGETGRASGSETVAWAGFTVDDQVEVSEVSSDCWLDQGVYFTIRGTPAAVDELLVTSDFRGEFAPGLDLVQASLFDESTVAEMQSVESAAESVARSGDGWVSRQVIRGELGGATVLFVAAYGN